MPLTVPEGLSDIPELEDLFNAAVEMIKAENTATTYVAKQKLTEAVQEKLALLLDTLKAQIES